MNCDFTRTAPAGLSLEKNGSPGSSNAADGLSIVGSNGLCADGKRRASESGAQGGSKSALRRKPAPLSLNAVADDASPESNGNLLQPTISNCTSAPLLVRSSSGTLVQQLSHSRRKGNRVSITAGSQRRNSLEAAAELSVPRRASVEFKALGIGLKSSASDAGLSRTISANLGLSKEKSGGAPAQSQAMRRRVCFCPTPSNTQHAVTPYARKYGQHPKFFDFDRKGEMRLNDEGIADEMRRQEERENLLNSIGDEPD